MSDAAGAAEPQERSDVRTLLRGIAVLVVVVAVAVLAISALPGVGELRERFRQTNGAWLFVSASFSLLSMIGYAAALRGAFDSIVPWRIAIRLGFAEQGTNVLLPAGGAGGPAFGSAVMRRAGVPTGVATERHVVLFLVTSGVSFAGLVVAGVACALGLRSGDTALVGSLVPAGAGALVLLTALAFARLGAPAAEVPASGLRRLIWRVRRFLHAGVTSSLVLMRRGDPSLVLGAVAYYAFDIAALAAAFQAFGGGGPELSVFVLAYTVGHAGALIPTPGGVGGTDGGLIGMFVVYGTSLDLATAAVLGYRVFQLGMPVVLGTIGVLRIQHGLRHGPPPEQIAEAYEGLARDGGRDPRRAG